MANPTLAYMLVLIPGVTWGLSFSLLRIAVESDMHPLALGFWQILLNAILLLAVCTATGKFRHIQRAHGVHYIVISFLGSVIPTVLYFYVASHLSAGIMAITIALVPLMTYGLAWLFGLESALPRRIFGIVLGFVAMLMITLPDTSLPDRSMIFWIIVATGSALCYTLENIYVDSRIPRSMDLVVLLTVASVLATICLLPVNLILGVEMLTWPGTRVASSLGLLAGINVVCYVVFLFVIRLNGSVFASQMGYVVTLSGVLWGIALFGETHSVWIWLALAVMLMGMALVTPRREVATSETL